MKSRFLIGISGNNDLWRSIFLGQYSLSLVVCCWWLLAAGRSCHFAAGAGSTAKRRKEKEKKKGKTEGEMGRKERARGRGEERGGEWGVEKSEAEGGE